MICQGIKVIVSSPQPAVVDRTSSHMKRPTFRSYYHKQRKTYSSSAGAK